MSLEEIQIGDLDESNCPYPHSGEWRGYTIQEGEVKIKTWLRDCYDTQDEDGCLVLDYFEWHVEGYEDPEDAPIHPDAYQEDLFAAILDELTQT